MATKLPVDVKKVFDALHKVESKKHVEYRVLVVGNYKLKYDTWNGDFYLSFNKQPVVMEDYLEMFVKEAREKYKLPSMRDMTVSELWGLLDYLYLKNDDIKDYFKK
jgi:hypothetical protein